MKPWRKSVAVVVLCSAATAAGFFGFDLFQRAQFAMAEEKVAVNREQLKNVEDLSTVFRHVGKIVEPSVVNINVRKTIKGVHPHLPFDEDQLRKFFPDRNGDGEPDLPPGFGGEGDDGTMEQIGTGSGVIMETADGAGYILTNNHVAGGATEMDITLSDGREIKNAKLLGADAKTDLAVVKIHAERLIPAKWGNSDELDKGDWVLAFGSPFGYVGSMTHGIISALNRTGVGILGAQGYENFIQVDAPINPGNSGGPLTNIHGEVVGINTAIASRSGGFQGIGFAIPSNQAKFVYAQLKDKGKVTRGWLGVSISDITKNLDNAKSFGFTGDKGVLVEQTFPNTPATGKLQPGDIVTQLDGKPVDNVQELRNAVAATPPGTEMKFTVFRDGKSQDVAVKIGDQPEDLMAAAGRSSRVLPGTGDTNAESLGMKLTTLTDELAEKFGLANFKGGALVTAVSPRSVAARAGLQPGDLITKVGSHEVATAKDASDFLAKADLAKGVRLYIASREGQRFVFLKNEKTE